MHRSTILTTVLSLLPACAGQEPPVHAGDVQVLDPRIYHLGDDPTPEWGEAPAEPDGTRVDLRFVPRSIVGEQVLRIQQRHVDNPWWIEINGQPIATLELGAELAEHHYVLPEGILRAGENTLALVPEKPTDDITVGNFRLLAKPLREVFRLRRVTIEVADAQGAPLPARVTITNDVGELVPIYYAESLHTAVRQGVVYTSRGAVEVELPEGSYEVYATRGAEWGLGRASLEVGTEGGSAALSMAREVDTTGFVACDTHIHTLTFSGHGDSSTEERVVTLAGEGVELAISTDHNHNTDYRPYQDGAGLGGHFTSVVGNEVTTQIGHFNAFPLDPADEVPDATITDPVRLVEEIRSHGAQVVVLNHPRWPDHERGPFGQAGLDRFTGERALAFPLTFDATELINSDTREDDPLFLFVDWFALLNHGERIVAVGSSDSHTVGSPVGQGRTYVRSATDDPARIDVQEACANIKSGRSSIGLGIFVDVSFAGGAGMGDLARPTGGRLRGTLSVQAPSWVRPRRALVYVNGVVLQETEWVEIEPQQPFARTVEIDVEWPYAHDAWVVCVVVGDAIEGPYWPNLNDYTLAATNPVWFDVDGDGRHASPREVAQSLLDDGGADVAGVRSSLESCDQAVAVQLLSLARAVYLSEAHERILQAADERAPLSPAVAEYLDSLAAPR